MFLSTAKVLTLVVLFIGGVGGGMPTGAKIRGRGTAVVLELGIRGSQEGASK